MKDVGSRWRLCVRRMVDLRAWIIPLRMKTVARNVPICSTASSDEMLAHHNVARNLEHNEAAFRRG
ncbi:hypothetical protein KCP69_03780 [Salmonella enterica subsp. enterica]|nr:hypothetical protein KCP69_03780 [Salmonella enterica subsp. enterica]